MPFTFGQHPWFPSHEGALVRFAAMSLWLCDSDGQTMRHVPIPPKADFATPGPPPTGYCNVCYAGWDGRTEIEWPHPGVGLSLVAEPVFGHLMFHVPADGQPVFCLEPQTAAPCAFDGLDRRTSSRSPCPRTRRPGIGTASLLSPLLKAPLPPTRDRGTGMPIS
jgi:aldose 1-epimerase